MGPKGARALIPAADGDEFEMSSRKYRRYFRNPHKSWAKTKRKFNRRVRATARRETRNEAAMV